MIHWQRESMLSMCFWEFSIDDLLIDSILLLYLRYLDISKKNKNPFYMNYIEQIKEIMNDNYGTLLTQSYLKTTSPEPVFR